MKKTIGLLLAVGILVSSCNMPATGSPDPQIATAAALTVQAVLNAPGTTPLASPTKSGSGAAATVTPTYSQPIASVGEVTNCRSGPGTNYERITQILPTDRVKIIGFFSPNYWVVSTKDGEECWLSGEFATPVGSFAAVPTVTAPPTPKGGAPEAPTFLKENGWTFSCSLTGQADITLSWNDKAINETGYRILRNSEVIAELAADTTFFAETIALVSGQGVAYQIRAYNLIGETDSAVATITCP